MSNRESAPHESGRRLPASAWRPGQSGNPAGKPKGTRNRATQIAQALLDGEVEGVVRKVVELALEGDTTAIKLVLERIVPPRKDAAVAIDLPVLASARDAAGAMSSLLSAVAEARMTPSEATAVAGLIEGYRRTLEVTELEQRICALEAIGDAPSGR